MVKNHESLVAISITTSHGFKNLSFIEFDHFDFT